MRDVVQAAYHTDFGERIFDSLPRVRILVGLNIDSGR
jgi:hypothetical protein